MKRQKIYIYSGVFLIAWLLTMITIPPPERNFLSGPTSNVQITRVRIMIQSFQARHKRVPRDLAELRTFAAERGHSFVPYDGYGDRLFYKDITDRYFLVASQSVSSKEGRMHRAASNIPTPKPPILVQGTQNAENPFYPAAFLQGSRVAKGRYIAQLFRNPTRNEKTLIVRPNGSTNLLYMAAHPGVEEFLWLDAKTIIYSATGQPPRDDGIFLWRFIDGYELNLLKSKSDAVHLKGGPDRPSYFISLSKVVGNKIYAFVAPHDTDRLDPNRFFSLEHYFVAEISSDFKGKIFKADVPILPKLYVVTKNASNAPPSPDPALQSWYDLPLQGEPGGVIESWQNFSLNYGQSPLFPYSLFWLSCLYHDAFHTMEDAKSRSAEPLRAFGAEIAGSLMTSSSTPTYLAAMAAHVEETLRNGKNLGFTIANYDVSLLPEPKP